MYNDRIIYDCKNAACTVPLTMGACMHQCWVRYKGKPKEDDNIAYWEHRAKHNDHLWVECSHCGFRIENYVAVVLAGCDTKFSDVKYKFCPMCGKEMRVHK